jgi:hypothetical protein
VRDRDADDSVAILNTALELDHCAQSVDRMLQKQNSEFGTNNQLDSPVARYCGDRGPPGLPRKQTDSLNLCPCAEKGSLCRMKGHIDIALSAEIPEERRWRGDNFPVGSLQSTLCRFWALSAVRCYCRFASLVEKSG